MMTFTTPAQVGVHASDIQSVMAAFQKYGVNLHSVLMARGDQIFFEHYWQPFTADRPHRLYSITKSFVAIAIGCLLDEGKVSLDDPIIRFFPDKLPPVVPEYLAQQTIRHMLIMNTCFAGGNWFTPDVTDRLAYYFAQKPDRPAGTMFSYDSTGSYVLGALVERLSGMKLLEYLKLKCLNRIGGFENAQMLEVPDGSAWGDSALLATPRALMNFARLLMQGGAWEGEQLISRDYVQAATSKLTDCNTNDDTTYDVYGYGYQIWMSEQGGFSFHGMGSQFAICVPNKDFIFVCTADNQLGGETKHPVIFESIFNGIVNRMADEPLPEEEPFVMPETQLPVVHGEKESPFAETINGAWFVCDENPMGIQRFCLTFKGDEGCLTYDNAQGRKELFFGMKRNVFGKFPQLGYSNDRGNVHEITDFRYDCAVSGGWVEEKKLQLKVQVIDRYFGRLVINLGFSDANTAGVYMVKTAEDFFREYEGWAAAKRA